jgi:putative tricarboxylic transport membrane protein
MLGLSVIASLAGDSLLKGLIAGVLGLMVATIGTDPVTGLNRFTFGSPELLSGIPAILVMVGLFAVSEMLVQTTAPDWEKATRETARIRFPTPAMWRRIARPQAIGSVIGAFEGMMPAPAGRFRASSRITRRVAGRGTARNSATDRRKASPPRRPRTTPVACTALVPMLSLGIPSSNSAAGAARRLSDARARPRADALRAARRGGTRACTPVCSSPISRC